MAGPTRLELATSGVTGRRSNQLNYDPVLLAAGHTAEGTRKKQSTTASCPSRLRVLSGTAFPPPPVLPVPNAKCQMLNAELRLSAAARNGRYRIRTCDSRRVKPVLYH